MVPGSIVAPAAAAKPRLRIGRDGENDIAGVTGNSQRDAGVGTDRDADVTDNLTELISSSRFIMGAGVGAV